MAQHLSCVPCLPPALRCVRVQVAQQRLEKAGEMLTAAEANGGNVLDVLQMVRASSLNCYVSARHGLSRAATCCGSVVVW